MRRSVITLALVCALPALVACGGSGSPRVSTVVRKVIVEQRARPHRHHHPPAPSTAATQSPVYAACDANITVRAQTTSCPFAENVFYEYWRSGGAGSISAYSPTTGSSFTLECTDGDEIECDTTSGAVIRFAAAAVDSYGPAQADHYARTHDTGGPPPAASTSAAPAGDAETPAGFCSSHECIPSFADGRGSIVQCADGEWSHSGGISGACSSHGGETDRTYP